MVRYVRWFDELSLDDVGLVGGKNASLGELHRELVPLGVRVPDGFAITAEAYWRVLDAASLRERLASHFLDLRAGGPERLAARASEARELVEGAPIPEDVWSEVVAAHDRLTGGDESVAVAVRSSATAEDLPTASFAGQQESYLNVRGRRALREACSRCFASLYTDRAVSYRIDRGFADAKVALSIGVQRMVRSDLGASGVLFTIDTESGFRDVVMIDAGWGLGENVVKGAISPDEIWLWKTGVREGKRSILRRRLGEKQLRMVYGEGDGAATRNERVADVDRRRFCLSDDDALALARQAIAIESHYSRKAGRDVPVDVEWAKDGETGVLWIVQARPETVESQRRRDVVETHVLERRGPVVATGQSVGQRIGSGRARVVASAERAAELLPGEVLVAPTTTPDWEPVMKLAAGIVTDRGGRTCHAAIVARELGIPAVVGTGDATTRIHDADEVTVSCAEGETGRVYLGALPHHVERVDVGALPRPRTRIFMNVADPGKAFGLATIPNDGVGLARIEFIIGNTIRVHPMALLHPERIDDADVRRAVADLVAGYADGAEYFVDRLAQGVGTIAAAFFPRPVVVRLSDFKTNEYASLLGGRAFEPHEENPMLGLRGAARYIHPAYREAFALECRAMRRVRGEMGLTNVKLMIPFCRRVEEGARVLDELERNGLRRGEDGLEVYVMCEIPNNVVLIDEFCRLFDGISIGSNDLTQLVLGVDRDSALVAFDFDERDPGVVEMMRRAIEGARRSGRHAGICGQAPSDHPELAEALVRFGIESMSLNPDTVLTTTMRILALERELASAAPERRAAPP